MINLSERASWWQIWWRVPYAMIRRNQERIFGRQSIWHDTHCMLYLDPDHTLSVQVPRAKWRKPVDYCRDRISIWRFTKYPLPFTADEIQVMRDYADVHLIGTFYDVGRLLDILINTTLGYPNVLHYKIFDFGKNLKVWKYRVVCAYVEARANRNARTTKPIRLFILFPPWLRAFNPERQTR